MSRQPRQEGGAARPRAPRVLNDVELALAQRPVPQPIPGAVPIRILTNFYEFVNKKDTGIYQYSIKIDPELPADAVQMRRGVIRSIGVQLQALFGQYVLQNTIMYASTKIDDRAIVIATEMTERRPPADAAPGAEGGEELRKTAYTVTLAYTREMNTRDPSTEINAFLNNLLRRAMRHLKLQQIRRGMFDPQMVREVQRMHFEVWGGYLASIVRAQGGNLLCVNTKSAVLRTRSALDEMNEARAGDFQDNARRLLVGQIVVSQYNKKTYKVTGVDFEKNPESTFPQKVKGAVEGAPSTAEVSFVEYYQKMYGDAGRITDFRQPLLEVERRKGKSEKSEKIFLIPELCRITGMTDRMRSDTSLLREMHTVTRVTPRARMDQCKKLLDRVATNELSQAELAKFNIEMNPNPVQVQGHLLGPAVVYWKDRNNDDISNPVNKEADFSKTFLSAVPFKTVEIRCWAVVSDGRHRQQRVQAINGLLEQARRAGLVLSDHPIEIDVSRAGYKGLIEDLKRDRVQVVLAVLGNRNEYNDVKHFMVRSTSIPTQCIMTKTIMKAQTAVYQKVLYQMIAKLGGSLWALDAQYGKKPDGKCESVMVVGIDVCHDKSSGNSVVGFTASIDSLFTEYYSRVVMVTQGQEAAEGLGICMQRALEVVQERRKGRSKILPDTIIVFRDGVSESQHDQILNGEVPQLQGAITKFENYRPKLAVVTVNKRINARFYSDRCDNPPPGTIIDSGVVKPTGFDFFLVSQFARQGCVSPTHYHVLYDNTQWPAGDFYTLSFRLTMMYFNWCGSIRVPAPVHYAHKLAEQIAQAVHDQPHLQLRDKLFYL